MKTITYASFNGRPTPVAYYIFEGDRCVFTGITDKGTSTINAVERIVEAIAVVEGRGIRELTFFDLQTRKGYSHYRSGEFAFSQLILSEKEGRVTSVVWRSIACPENVRDEFRDFIY